MPLNDGGESASGASRSPAVRATVAFPRLSLRGPPRAGVG